MISAQSSFNFHGHFQFSLSKLLDFILFQANEFFGILLEETLETEKSSTRLRSTAGLTRSGVQHLKQLLAISTISLLLSPFFHGLHSLHIHQPTRFLRIYSKNNQSSGSKAALSEPRKLRYGTRFNNRPPCLLLKALIGHYLFPKNLNNRSFRC